MNVVYYKRFRMEIDLFRTPLPVPILPDEYDWVSWSPGLVERHAAVKFSSFRTEIDAQVFPCLGSPLGCSRLMNEIATRRLFLPGATWLIHCVAGELVGDDCATIQGIAQDSVYGAVQNVGVAPAHRGLGLGRALVLKSLWGFRAAGLERVFLEVTARNTPAVQLYRSLGFRLARTSYKAVEHADLVTAW